MSFRSIGALFSATLFSFNSMGNDVDNQLSMRFAQADGDTYQQEVRLDFDARISLWDTWEIMARTRLQHDGKTNLRSQHYDDLLREFYVARNWKGWDWKLGKQIHNWTQMDNLISFEQVSPRDYQEFILPNFSESARGQWMISAAKNTDSGQWQFLVVPEARPHKLPSGSDWYAFKAPRLRYGFPFVEGQASVNAAYPEPEKGLMAVRYEGFEQQWQWSLQMRYGLDFEPLANNAVDGQGNPTGVALFHENRLSLGASASMSLGDTVLRTEVSVSPDRHFNTSQLGLLGTERADQMSVAVGADMFGPWDTFINVQVLWDRVYDAPINLVRPDSDVLWSATIRKSFLNEYLQTEVRFYGSDDGDGLTRVSAKYLVSDAFEVTVGWDEFHGDETGYFGQYAELDRVHLTGNWYF